MLDLSARYREIDKNIRTLFDETGHVLKELVGADKLSFYSYGQTYEVQGKFGETEYRVSKFAISLMPNCAVVAISCDVLVFGRFRNKGVATFLSKLRTEALTKSGIKSILCTVVDSNEYQLNIMAKEGYVELSRFKNDYSYNNLIMFEKKL